MVISNIKTSVRVITCIAKHLVLDNNLVCVERLSIHFVSMVLISKIEQHLPRTENIIDTTIIVSEVIKSYIGNC